MAFMVEVSFADGRSLASTDDVARRSCEQQQGISGDCDAIYVRTCSRSGRRQSRATPGSTL